jgi:hypothetical protein
VVFWTIEKLYDRTRPKAKKELEPKKKRWVANRYNICEKEFEESRRCLLNSYHSYVQTHAGYMIAITIGFLTIISNFDSFFKSGPVIATLSISTVFLTFTWGFLAFLILIFLILFASWYMIKRIRYWASYASLAVSLTFDDAILLFNEYNAKREKDGLRYYYEKALCTAILQLGGARNKIIESEGNTR